MNTLIHFKGEKLKKSFICSLLLTQFAFSLTFAQGDSTHYLTQKDTLFMYLDEQSSEKLIEHHIQKKQTLYSLARFYGLNEEQLYPYNPTLKNNVVSVGQVVRVPLPNRAIKRFKGQNFKRWRYAPLMFKVQKGDNLYKIAKRVFHMSPDSVIAWNELESDIISPGQVLQVGWVSVEGIPDSMRVVRTAVVDLNRQALAKKISAQKKMVEERGAAFWQVKGNQNTDYYCLHRTARVGSVISLTNGMNGKTALAKVIGKMPEKAYESGIIVVVAPSVARSLGARDGKFFVKIKYKP